MEDQLPTKFVQIERRNKLAREEIYDFFRLMEKKVWASLPTEQIPFLELSGKISKSVLTPKDTPIPDCQTCGLCCTAFTSVPVSESDQISPENYWEIFITGKNGEAFTVNRLIRRDGETGYCAALKGEPGKFVSCSIYDERPRTCRSFEAGSDTCHALRRNFNLEPPLNDFEIFSAIQTISAKDAPEGLERKIVHTEINEIPENKLEIKCWLEDYSEIVLHQFDYSEESWLEAYFTGKTLAEAQELIARRIKQI